MFPLTLLTVNTPTEALLLLQRMLDDCCRGTGPSPIDPISSMRREVAFKAYYYYCVTVYCVRSDLATLESRIDDLWHVGLHKRPLLLAY